MVHGELIKAGKVEPLTYRQVRRLEKIDKDKERDKALVQLADTAIRAVGQTIEGAFAGAGLAMQGYLTGDAIAFAAKSVAGIIFLEWVVTSFPNFSRNTHLDYLLFRNGGKTPNITNINDEAKADIADLRSSLSQVVVPGWLTATANAKSITELPDLSQPIRQFADANLAHSFLQDGITAATGGGEGPLIADFHTLYELFKNQASGAQGSGINPYISGSFGSNPF